MPTDPKLPGAPVIVPDPPTPISRPPLLVGDDKHVVEAPDGTVHVYDQVTGNLVQTAPPGTPVEVFGKHDTVDDSGTGRIDIDQRKDAFGTPLGPNHDTINVHGDSAHINDHGADDVINVSGNSDVVSVDGSGNAVTVTGNGGKIQLGGQDNAAVIYGDTTDNTLEVHGTSNSAEVYGSGNVASVDGTDNQLTDGGRADRDIVGGTNNHVTVADGSTDNTLAVFGEQNTAVVDGVGNIATIGGQQNRVSLDSFGDTVNVKGEGDTATVGGELNTVTVVGAQNSLAVTGSQDSATVAGTHNSSEITGERNTTIESGKSNQTVVDGTNNATAASGSDGSIFVYGNNNDTHVSGQDNSTTTGGHDNTTDVRGPGNTGKDVGTANSAAEGDPNGSAIPPRTTPAEQTLPQPHQATETSGQQHDLAGGTAVPDDHAFAGSRETSSNVDAPVAFRGAGRPPVHDGNSFHPIDPDGRAQAPIQFKGLAAPSHPDSAIGNGHTGFAESGTGHSPQDVGPVAPLHLSANEPGHHTTLPPTTPDDPQSSTNGHDHDTSHEAAGRESHLTVDHHADESLHTADSHPGHHL